MRSSREHFVKSMMYPLATDAQINPPVPCEFQVGDLVTYTNDYGAVFNDRIVTGFSPTVENGRFIYFDHAAWWFPVGPRSLKKQAQRTEAPTEADACESRSVGLIESETGKITKVTHTIRREDGSEAKIVATAYFGAGLHQSIGVDVFRRENEANDWHLCSDRPHPNWLSMPVDEYIKCGRSEVLRTVSIAEVLRATNEVGHLMSDHRSYFIPFREDVDHVNEQPTVIERPRQ
jgi:hypothetical protein